MPKLDLSGPAPRALAGVAFAALGGALLAVGVPASYRKSTSSAPLPAVATEVKSSLTGEAVAAYVDPVHADAKLEHPVYRATTACPTPAQKEAAFGDLPEPPRLPHMDAPRELADPGPPAAEATLTPRTARLLLDRARLRARALADDLDRLAEAVAAVSGEGVAP